MTDIDKTEAWEELMKNPLAIDQPVGTEVTDAEVYRMQVRQPDGTWMPFDVIRTDRDVVTRIQAFHLGNDPEDTGLRVWKGVMTWTLEEAPGRGEGQTPPEEILARNEENTKRLLDKEENQQPTR